MPAGFRGLPSSLWDREGSEAPGLLSQAFQAAKWDAQSSAKWDAHATSKRPSWPHLQVNFLPNLSPATIILLVQSTSVSTPAKTCPFHEGWPVDTGPPCLGMTKIYQW